MSLVAMKTGMSVMCTRHYHQGQLMFRPLTGIEAIYADDAMHGFVHQSPDLVIEAVRFTAASMKAISG